MTSLPVWAPHCEKQSRRRRQVNDSITPVPCVAFISPELCEQPRLVAVVDGANAATEQDESAMILARAEYLTRVPRERRPVKCHEHQAGFRASNQQRGVVEPQP